MTEDSPRTKRKYKARPKRHFMLRVRMSDSDLRLLQRAAAHAGLSMSEWIRLQLNRKGK